jgi:predicted Zn-dependent protease
MIASIQEEWKGFAVSQATISILSALLAATLLTACQTSALGRSQFKLMPESVMSQMGVTAFAEISQQTAISSNASVNRAVACVADAVTRAISGGYTATRWEVRVFKDDSPNAFALPGGKIGVNTGMVRVAKNQHQFAAVIGHEVSHVLAGHANERVSADIAARGSLQLVQAALGDPANPMHGQMMGLLGAGAQVIVLLPYSRAHEREADLMGLDLMARAGFDPRESIALWRNMAAAGGAQPPEFLSTHPSHGTRIADLNQRMSHAMRLFAAAASSGRVPDCR